MRRVLPRWRRSAWSPATAPPASSIASPDGDGVREIARARSTARCRARRSPRAAARARRRRAARCTASGTASGRSASRNVRPRRGFSTATVPSSRSGQEDVVVGAALGARHLAQVGAPAVLEQRVRPRLALPGREARRLLPGLRQRHDRARRRVQAAAGLEERGADDAVVPPHEMVRLAGEVLDALAQRQHRRAALEPHAPLERERRERAAHAADQLDGVVAARPPTVTSHGRQRDLAVERELDAAVAAGVVAAREELLPAALVVVAGTPCPSQPSRGGAPGGCRPQGDLKRTSTPVERSRNS